MRYFEDFAVGDRFAFDEMRVSEKEMLDFAHKYDPQAIHIDPAAARESIYGGVIASGMLTMIFMLRMSLAALGGGAFNGSPGWDELRWLKPVRAGDRLSLDCEVLETRASRSRPQVGIVRASFTLRNQTGEPVATAIPAWFVGRRPEAA